MWSTRAEMVQNEKKKKTEKDVGALEIDALSARWQLEDEAAAHVFER